MQSFLFTFLYAIVWMFSLLPLRILFIFSDMLFLIVWYVLPYRRKVVLNNLRNSFPEKSESEINDIARKFYRHFCDLVFEVIKLNTMSEKTMRKHWKVKNPEVINQYYDQGRHLAAILAHYGNWEWNTAMSLIVKYPVYSIFKRLSNKRMDELMSKIRSRFGGKPVEMANVLRELITMNNEGKPIAPGFIADQSPHKTEHCYWMNFLNQDTSVYLGIEHLAVKFNMIVVYFDMQKISRGYYEVDVITLCENPKELKEYEITEKHVRLLEKKIQERPEFWLWTHRRWKRKRKIEKP